MDTVEQLSKFAENCAESARLRLFWLLGNKVGYDANLHSIVSNQSGARRFAADAMCLRGLTDADQYYA